MSGRGCVREEEYCGGWERVGVYEAETEVEKEEG